MADPEDVAMSSSSSHNQRLDTCASRADDRKLADAEAGDMSVQSSPRQLVDEAEEGTIVVASNGGKDTVIPLDSSSSSGIDVQTQSTMGSLHISVVEGRNFVVTDRDGQLRPSVELQIGETKVRTDTLKDTLSPSWLADFNLPIPCEESKLWVSVIDSALLHEGEILIGRGAVAVSDLLCSGTRVQWIQIKDVDDKEVGEVCIVLRYSDYQALPSSTAASTSSETKDDNQYGLKALLCPAQSSSHNQAPSAIQDSAEVLEEDRLEVFSAEATLMEECMRQDPSTLKSQGKSLTDEPCGEAIAHKKDQSSKGTSSHSAPRRIMVFAGAVLAVLAAIAWNKHKCKKRASEENKV